jgi:hypothetical protein
MSYFDGYAMKPNEQQLKEEIFNKYASADYTDVISLKKSYDYNCVKFEGSIRAGSKLNEEELLLYANHGNLCFGGSCVRIGDKFYGSYSLD